MLTANKRAVLIAKLIKIPGIGLSRARAISMRITKVSELRNHPALITKETQLFLRMRPLRAIPRKSVTALLPKLYEIARVANVKMRVVGSYRRKVALMHDIDIMISCKRRTASCDCISRYISAFAAAYTIELYSRGKFKTSFYMVAKSRPKRLVYKIDVFHVAKNNEAAAMLLYTTGDRVTNLQMRVAAKSQGMLLNQHGLFNVSNGRSRRRVTGLQTERDYFRALNMRYKSPQQRTH